MKDESSNPSESLWRRKLNAADRAELRAQPELELEASLTEALAKMPDAPVSSNFTARVLDAIELEGTRAARLRWHWNWRLLWPRMAFAAAVLIFAGVGLRQHEVNVQRAALAKRIASIAVAQPLPSVDALENLDVIQRMSQPAHADEALLASLQ